MPSSLRLRLAPFTAALVALVTAGALLWLLLPRLLEQGAAYQMLEVMEMLEPLVARHTPGAGEEGPSNDRPGEVVPSEGDLQRWVAQLGGAHPLRITVIGADGRVVADSARAADQVPLMDNHAGRPEVAAATAEGEGYSVRESDTTGIVYVYAARPFIAPSGERYILRLARPYEQLSQLKARMTTVLLLALLAALAALAAMALWIENRLFRPLVRLVEGARRLASGHYGDRLSLPGDDYLRSLARALNLLGGRVEEQITAAKAERDHLRTILARMSEGVLVVDAEGRAVLVNEAADALFNLQGDVTGRPPREIARQPQLAELIERTLRDGAGSAVEMTLELPERRTLLLASASLGRDAGAVVAVQDTTAFTRLTETRRDFVANVSHELKTPLAAIRGYAETLRDGALQDRQAAGRFVDRVLVQCHRLQALLEDLLTLSRLESVDEASRPLRPVDLAPIVARAVELTGDAAAAHGVTIEVDAPGPLRLEGDPDALERLLINLLTNAVAYNRKGGCVNVSAGGDEEHVKIEVADTGIGIPPDALPRIFERFYRVDKGRSRQEGGTGLGLAIVKHTAQLHRGWVEVESEEGVGSLFRVYLARRPANRQPAPGG